jgi:hypothetical protein
MQNADIVNSLSVRVAKIELCEMVVRNYIFGDVGQNPLFFGWRVLMI